MRGGELIKRLRRAQGRGEGQWRACCPAHEDHTPSLEIRESNGKILLWCGAGCSVESICDALGIKVRDLHYDVASSTPVNPTVKHNAAKNGTKGNGSAPRFVEAYDYCDEAGKLLFQTVRYAPKDFRQRRPDGKGGWIWDLKGVRLVLYNLPEVMKAQCVLIPEGEKDCGTAGKLGFTATTNPMGAGKWRDGYSEALRGKDCILFPDQDENRKGQEHGLEIATSLHLRARSIKIVNLPCKDLSVWVEQGHTREELNQLIEQALVWTPGGKSAETPDAQAGIVLQCFKDVESKPLRWLWYGRIPLNKLILFSGDPDQGKSLVTLDVISRMTRAAAFPDGAPCEQGSAIILSAEDDAEDTLRPRLDAAGADVSRVYLLQMVRVRLTNGELVEKEFSLDTDLLALEKALDEHPDVRLIVIDPISSYLGAIDAHKNSEVRRILTPLTKMAARRGVTIIALNHLRKADGPAIHRSIDSVAFVAAARAVWDFAQDPDDEDRHFMVVAKGNLGKKGHGLAYRVTGQIGSPYLEWDSTPVTMSANDALGGTAGQESSERREATGFLEETLGGGPRPVKEVKGEARRAGITEHTLVRARYRLGVKARKQGFGGGWEWVLPEDVDAKDANATDTRRMPLKINVASFEQVSETKPVISIPSPKDATLSERGTLRASGERGILGSEPPKQPAGGAQPGIFDVPETDGEQAEPGALEV